MKSDDTSLVRKNYLVIPNVCRNSNVLAIMIISQLMITIAWLSSNHNWYWVSYGLWSLYAQWVVLLSTFLLCYTRSSIEKYNYWFGCIFVVLLCLISLFLVELVTVFWQMGFSAIELDVNRLQRLSVVVILLSIGLSLIHI